MAAYDACVAASADSNHRYITAAGLHLVLLALGAHGREEPTEVRKRIFYDAILCYKNDRFAKTGSGSIGKVERKTMRFLLAGDLSGGSEGDSARR
jgi:hypothetical protein